MKTPIRDQQQFPSMRIKKSAKIRSGNTAAFAHSIPVSKKANSQIYYQLIYWCSVCFFPYPTHLPSFLIDEKIDHNRTMLDREVHWEMPQPFRKISEYRNRQGIGGEAVAAGGAGKGKDTLRSKEDVLLCRGF